jgi:hypothetical protein
MWAGLSSALGGAAAAGGAGAAAGGASAVGATTAAKMLTLGTLLGGTVTVGLAAMAIRFTATPPAEGVHKAASVAGIVAKASTAEKRAPSQKAVTDVTVAESNPTGVREVTWEELAVREVTWEQLAPFSTATASAGATATATPAPPHSSASPSHADALAQEASLVAQARAALVRGDPRLALQAIQTARTLPSRQLVPEELTVEAQALRALGREDDANQADAVLKARYPESALAR